MRDRLIVRNRSMAILQKHKQSDSEKRMKMLQQQLYGKSDLPLHEANRPSSTPAATTDTSYLKHDLSKILLLSTIALSAQFILYFLERR